MILSMGLIFLAVLMIAGFVFGCKIALEDIAKALRLK
jgi:hypothetical protein